MELQIKDIKLSKKTILKLLECKPETYLYEKMAQEFEILEKVLLEKIKPMVAFEWIKDNFCFHNEILDNCSHKIYVVITIGAEIVEEIEHYFQHQKVLEGLMLNCMADDYLCKLEMGACAELVKMSKAKGMGLTTRFVAGDILPIEQQKIIVKKADPLTKLNLAVNESFMISPLKSLALVFGADEKNEIKDVSHFCESCTLEDCNMRKKNKTVNIISSEYEKNINVENEMTVLELLRENDIFINASCNGKGTCGKCKVDICDENEEKQSMLACKTMIKDQMNICIEENYKNYEVVAVYEFDFDSVKSEEDTKFGLAVDIGTTTIAIQLVNLKTKKIEGTYSVLNSQAQFGADVISRIESANKGNLEMLTGLIKYDILEGLTEMLTSGIAVEKITQMVIVGNTTMLHILLGLSCEGLGEYPFSFQTNKPITKSFVDLFINDMINCDVTILPCISAFVGGDITSGIFLLDFVHKKETSLFIDMGTNGEMALLFKGKIICTSAAAGPAFEGGNIRFGTGSVNGAISKLKYEMRKFTYETIHNEKPVGICGSGIMDFMGECVKNKLVDRTGLLDENIYDEEVFIAMNKFGERIYITQKDIREFQLAKAAIRAAMETLFIKCGITYDDIDNVYLAGGFGYKINIDNAMLVGVLPKEFKNKITASGNTALGGAVKYLFGNNREEDVAEIMSKASEIELANDELFNELFVKHMYF